MRFNGRPTTEAGALAALVAADDASGGFIKDSQAGAGGLAVLDDATVVAAFDTVSAAGADIASATTTDIGAATGSYVHITGTTTITGLGTVAAGVQRTVKFTGALTLTHNATSLILPASANITTAANDTAKFVSLGSGNWVCLWYKKANGFPLAYSAGSWTPTLGGNTTYTAREGTYIRIGNLVFVRGSITVNALGTGSTSTLGGLPFVAANNNAVLAVGTSTGLAVTPVAFAFYVAGGNAVATGRTAANASVTDSLGVFGNGARVDFSGCYEV